jgi:hypothetical protein
MTKRRFKFGLAFLGVLGLLFLALFALMFLPSLASADKGTGYQVDGDSHAGSHNFTHPGAGKDDGPADDSGHGRHDPAHGDAGPCVGRLCEAWNDGALGGDPFTSGGHDGHDYGSFGGANGGSGNSSGGSEGGQGGGWGPLAGGWAPGVGGAGGGGSGDPSNSCSGKNCGKDSGDGNNHGDNGSHGPDGDGSPAGDNDPPPGPNDFPFTTPSFSGGPGDGNGGHPTNDALTDPPADVPEPLTLSLFAVGLAGAGVLRRRAHGSRAD